MAAESNWHQTRFLSRSIAIKNIHAEKNVYLASLVVEDALRVFEHLLPPQVKEVIRVRVEFEPVFSVIPKKEEKDIVRIF